MTREHYGRDCKVCLKPFTIFRWCPGPRMKFRRTEICSTCAKLKNLCQSCMLDLEYGLPAQVRDAALGVTENVPKNEANREFFIATNKARLERGDSSLVQYDAAGTPEARSLLERLAKKSAAGDGSTRNLAPPCSFYAKGKCTRGDTCPYRHTLVAERYPSLQSYRNRYYGENDPAAKHVLEQHRQLAELSDRNSKGRRETKERASTPIVSDTNVLVVTGLETEDVELDDIQEYFESRGFKARVQAAGASNVRVTLEDDRDVAAVLQTVGHTIKVNGVELQVSPRDASELDRSEAQSGS